MAVALDSSSECFTNIMATMPGFRFHPTDEELVACYLKTKMCGRKLKLDVIREIDVYKWEPEELPGQSILKTGDRQWFFFSPKERRYPNGARSNRATREGYWKLTGKDRNVTCNSRTVGVKKTLIFYKGRAANGERTDWVMHEYTLDEEELKRCKGIKDYYALYKVFKKSGPGPKNGEQYGAPFKEEEWQEDDIVDFNVTIAVQLNAVPQLDEVASVDNVTINGQVQQPLLDDDVEGIMREVMGDDFVLDQLQANVLPQATVEETGSSVMDRSAEPVLFTDPIQMFHPRSQQSDVQNNYDLAQSANSHLHSSAPSSQKELLFCKDDFLEIDDLIGPGSNDFAQSANSHLHVDEALKVSSAPSSQKELPFCKDDFLEIDDLIGPEPTLSNIDNPIGNLQFEDGLSEFDLYHDAQMFLHDMGPISQETVSNLSILDDVVNQGYEILPNQEVVNQAGSDLWMHGQRNILSPAEQTGGSSSLPTSGVVYESASFPTEGNENHNSTMEGVATSGFSSALWAFVESIPTTPASAAENALANRAFERMSSFSRARMNVKPTNVAAGNDTATMKRSGRKGVRFLFFPVLVALCAFLWVSLATQISEMRLLKM